MDDTAIADSSDSLTLDDVELEFGDDDADDSDDDISVINFGGDDFDIDDDETGAEDSIVMDVDMDADKAETRTGTFAPGDFEEPTATVASLGDMDDIGDLMLPDDVDEVATKLDLARAFIDMGDAEGARGSLKEVMSEGNDEQKAEAQSLLEQI
jgi:pilus assembly protein FimV